MLDFIIICILVAFIILLVYELKSIIKYIKLLKELLEAKSKFDTEDIEYFRNIPDEKYSPAEAVFICESKYEPKFGEFSRVFSATILSLACKEYFELKVKEAKDKNEKDMVYMKFQKKFNMIREGKKYHINDKPKDITEDEAIVLEYILKVAEDRDKMPVKNLKAYALESETHRNELIGVIEDMQNKVEVSHRLKGNINLEGDRQLKKINEEIALNIGVMILIITMAETYVQFFGAYFVFAFVLAVLFMILPGINVLILRLLKHLIPYLSKKGAESREQWKGLEKYIKDYTLLGERDSISVHLYEKYMVFATAFGISKKALKEIKTADIEELEKIDFDKKDMNILEKLDRLAIASYEMEYIIDDVFRSAEIAISLLQK